VGLRLAVENSQTEHHAPPHMPMPHWEWDTAAGPRGSRVAAVDPQTDEPEPAFESPRAGPRLVASALERRPR
jgi:hypothetical protein